MEGRLLRLFDFQRFEGNLKLKSIIDATHMRYNARQLSDTELDYVSAAGIPELPKQPDPHKKPK